MTKKYSTFLVRRFIMRPTKKVRRFIMRPTKKVRRFNIRSTFLVDLVLIKYPSQLKKLGDLI
jgi:hypothetical protein